MRGVLLLPIRLSRNIRKQAIIMSFASIQTHPSHRATMASKARRSCLKAKTSISAVSITATALTILTPYS